MSKYEAAVEWYWLKNLLQCHFVHQKPHKDCPVWTWSSKVTGQQLTSLTMTWLSSSVLVLWLLLTAKNNSVILSANWVWSGQWKAFRLFIRIHFIMRNRSTYLFTNEIQNNTRNTTNKCITKYTSSNNIFIFTNKYGEILVLITF